MKCYHKILASPCPGSGLWLATYKPLEATSNHKAVLLANKDYPETLGLMSPD